MLPTTQKYENENSDYKHYVFTLVNVYTQAQGIQRNDLDMPDS